MSARSRDSTSTSEDPETEADGAARRREGDDVRDSTDRNNQSDEPEGEVLRDHTEGDRHGAQGYSELPEGSESQLAPGAQGADVGVADDVLNQNGVGTAGALIDEEQNEGCESEMSRLPHSKPQAGEAEAQVTNGASYGSVQEDSEITTSESDSRPEGCDDGAADRPEGCADCVTEDSIDDNLQAVGKEETEDSVEDLHVYREGELGVMSNSNSNAESLAQHLDSLTDEAVCNGNGATDARTEDDIFEFSDPDARLGASALGSREDVHVRLVALDVSETECAEADNGTRTWTQELGSDDSSESDTRQVVEPGSPEVSAPPSGAAQLDSSAVESDNHESGHVNPRANEVLSESEPEENACDENLCNDSVEADSSQSFVLPDSGSGDTESSTANGDSCSEAERRNDESESAESSGDVRQIEEADPSVVGAAGRSERQPSCAGESVGNDGVFSNMDELVVQQGASESETGLDSARSDPPLGDISHTSGTPEGGEPGDEPEDSHMGGADQPPNNVASESDLYAPECDRGPSNANSSAQPSPGVPAAEGHEVPVQEAAGEEQSEMNSSSAEGSEVDVNLPPCQQGAFHMEDIDLRSDQLCSGISGSDLGEDFLRSADMLQSLTENKSCGSERSEGEESQVVTVSENIDSNSSSALSNTDSSSGHQVNLQPQPGAAENESETNMQPLTALQASAVAACALQESNLTNDCAPHSSRDSCSEHSSSDSNSSSLESLPCAMTWEQSESERRLENSRFEALQGSSASTCIGNVAGDDDLLSELDAELEINTAGEKTIPVLKTESSEIEKPEFENLEIANLEIENLEIVHVGSTEPVNGLRALPAVPLCEMSAEKLRQVLAELQNQLSKKDSKIAKLHSDKSQQAERLGLVIQERDTYLKQLEGTRSKQQAHDLYLPQIKELENTISQQQNEIRGLKDKLSSHDAAAKRAVTSLQNELKVRVDQVTKMYEDCRKEKDSMVMKYAQAEHKNIELQKATEKAEGRLKDILREREIFLTKARQLKADYQRTCSELQTKTVELETVSRELDKHKELVSSAEVRIKWAQNKMKAELESHKETKKELEKSNVKIKEAKEETEQIRQDCQAIIKTYQESEEMKSSTLDQRLRKKETELLLEKREKTDQGEIHNAVLRELETLKVQYKDIFEELKTYKDKVRAQESERLTNEDTMTKYKDIIQSQKKENRDLQAKIDKLFYIQSDFDRAQDTIKCLDADIRDLKLANKEMQAEIESCRKRESDLLELTKKLTGKNAHLQSDNTTLNGKVLNLSSDNQKKAMEIQEFETKLKHVSDNLADEIKARKDETEKLKASLQAKTKATEDLGTLVDEQKDEMKTLKRKHANNVKDLTRQLQQARRKLESMDAKGENKESLSMGSRTSSNGSLNTPQGDVNGGNANPAPKVPVEPPPQEYPVIVEQVEIDRQVLIDRIVKLQKAHARKNEKIEFMEDHIKQLVVEVKKKKKIIQNYVLREEAGALSTENMDLNKAELSKRGGIMASVYSSHAADSHMNLELSLEINKKLQSVLEDTLLKNITLKENIDTLGEEIARLSQENRRLQLSIQGLS